MIKSMQMKELNELIKKFQKTKQESIMKIEGDVNSSQGGGLKDSLQSSQGGHRAATSLNDGEHYHNSSADQLFRDLQIAPQHHHLHKAADNFFASNPTGPPGGNTGLKRGLSQVKDRESGREGQGVVGAVRAGGKTAH